MNLPKFIITLDGYFRFGQVNQHKHLLKPGDQCIGGGYYHFDFVSNRILLDRESYDFGRPKVVNAVLGECIWNLSYSERRMAIELELTVTLDDDAIGNLCCQFPITADYDGIGAKGSKFAFYL